MSSKWEKCEFCEVIVWKGSFAEFGMQKSSSIIKTLNEETRLTKIYKCESKDCEMYQLNVFTKENRYRVREDDNEKGIEKKTIRDYMYWLKDEFIGVILIKKKGRVWIFEEYYMDGFKKIMTYYGVRFYINESKKDEYITKDKWITSQKNIGKYRELLWKTGEIYGILPNLTEEDNPWRKKTKREPENKLA